MFVLVTGGAGYIGSHTCIELIKAGFEPVIIDNLSNSKLVVLDRIETITGKRPAFMEGDILDSAFLDAVFAQYSFAAVMHFAGLKAVGESVQKPLWYYENNVSGTLNLIKAMALGFVIIFMWWIWRVVMSVRWTRCWRMPGIMW